MGDLIAAGLAPADALFAFGAYWHLMLGELLDRHPDDLGERPTQRERALINMDTTAYPNYAHVLEHLDPSDGPPPSQFAASIELLLDGVFAQHA